MPDTAVADPADPAVRRARRAGWTIVRSTLEKQAPGNLVPSPAVALAAMWQVALDAWALSGLELPSYGRAQTPLARRRLDRDEQRPTA